MNSPVEAEGIKAVFCHISQKTLPNLDLCTLLSPNKVVSSKGRLSSKCRMLTQESESCGLLLHHQCQKKGFITVLSGIWMNYICTVTRSKTSHKSVSIIRQIQLNFISIIFLKTFGLFGSFLCFASFKHKEKHASLRTACFSDNKKPLNSDNFKYAILVLTGI